MVPAHFEADAYAGLRRMVHTGLIPRESVADALTRIVAIHGERVPLGPLVPAAYRIYDTIGAHDVFYVVLAQIRAATLLTCDGPLARAAQQLGVKVLLREADK